jgi:hypothetical protein
VPPAVHSGDAENKGSRQAKRAHQPADEERDPRN